MRQCWALKILKVFSQIKFVALSSLCRAFCSQVERLGFTIKQLFQRPSVSSLLLFLPFIHPLCASQPQRQRRYECAMCWVFHSRVLPQQITWCEVFKSKVSVSYLLLSYSVLPSPWKAACRCDLFSTWTKCLSTKQESVACHTIKLSVLPLPEWQRRRCKS